MTQYLSKLWNFTYMFKFGFLTYGYIKFIYYLLFPQQLRISLYFFIFTNSNLHITIFEICRKSTIFFTYKFFLENIYSSFYDCLKQSFISLNFGRKLRYFVCYNLQTKNSFYVLCYYHKKYWKKLENYHLSFPEKLMKSRCSRIVHFSYMIG